MGEGIFNAIKDKLGRFIFSDMDKKNNFRARICIEIDFSKGLPKVIQLNFDSWSHVQALDYEKVSLNVFFVMSMGTFAKIYPKASTSLIYSNHLPFSHSNYEQGAFKPITRKQKNYLTKRSHASKLESHQHPPFNNRYRVLKSSKTEVMGDDSLIN